MKAVNRQLQNKNHTHGFAMLFTVLVMTLILSIALGISNITYKQTILSSLAKDSEIALYQADAGVECALYYDFKLRLLTSAGPASMNCGNVTLNQTSSVGGVYTYQSSASASPCIASVSIDKSGTILDGSGNVVYQVTSSGNNICQSNPRQVERTLQVRYIP